jgi:hypothetical protein
MVKPWFSLYDKERYKGTDSPFPVLANYPGISELQSSYLTVYEELNKYLQKNQLKPQFNGTMVETPKSWKVRSLKVWGVEMFDVQEQFPATMRLLNNIPNVVNVGFNLLEPGAKIKPHNGDTDAIYRCHLGLKIPVNFKACALKVLNEEKHWEPGKVIIFNDAFEHEACNYSNEQRIILLFDILKPQYLSIRNKICATVLLSFYLQQVGNAWKGIYKMDRRIFRYLIFPMVTFIRVMIPFRNWIKRK